MKKVLLTLILTIVLSNLTIAQKKGLGLGLMFGEPTGLSGNYWLSQKNAVDFGIGFSPFNFGNRVSLHADYIYHNFDILKADVDLNFYYGFGVRLRFKSGYNSNFGVRGVAGIVWRDYENPLDIFFEAVPVFRLFPTTQLNLDLAIGARWYFKELAE